MRRVAAAMLHLQEVADGVVHIALDVRAHGIAVAGMVEPGVEAHCTRRASSAECGSPSACLTQMLAAGGLNQPVEGVVGVVVARLDALVPEVDGLLRVVLDVGDVAGRVVGVVQVLHLAARASRRAGAAGQSPGKAGRIAPGEQLRQPEGERVVAVEGAGAVLVVDALTLALGVVVDVGDADR